MKRFLFWSVLFSFLIPAVSFSKIISVSIPSDQKMLVLDSGSDFQFNVSIFDDELGKLNVPVLWTLTDLNGFETTAPGAIDSNGKLHIFFTYEGVFKVKVTEPTSALTDEAFVEVRPQSTGAWFVEVSPQHIYLPIGGATNLSVRCYDRQGHVMRSCTLRYSLRDHYGRLVNSFIYIDNRGVLYVSRAAWRGHYSLNFQAVDGPGQTTISLDIY